MIKKNNFSSYFLSGKIKKQKKIFYDIIDIGFDFISGKERQSKVIVYKKAADFKKELIETLPKKGIKLNKVKEILKNIGHYSISQSDLNYLAFPDSGNSIPALMGDIYSKFLNQNLIAFDRSAPISTFLEIQLIEWLRELIGYDYKPVNEIDSLAEVSGMCTTGGHMSNHIAILSALNSKFPQIKKNGLASLPFSPKAVIASKISHYSVSAAIHHLGIGTENILNVESTSDFTTDINDLEKILESHKQANDIFIIVAVAGNTRTSSIDNIEEIAAICKKYHIWLHVDACHGGSLLFSEKLKSKHLTGIEMADSVSLDPHKGMFVTYPSSYVLFKKRDELVKFTRYEEQVRNGEAWDLAYITPFYGSRGFESLKLWLQIKTLGKEKLSEIIEKRDEDAFYIFNKVSTSNYFVLFHDMTFYRMAFVYLPKEVQEYIKTHNTDVEVNKQLHSCVDFYTHKINQELYEEGNVCLDEFKLHDIGNTTGLNSNEDRYYVMSITVGNPLYTKDSLNKSISYLLNKCEIYKNKMLSDVKNILENKNYTEKVKENYGPAGWK